MKISIINSKGHWINGWAVNPSVLGTVVEILQKAGFSVEVHEVVSLKELKNRLEKTDSRTLVWPNAYLVNAGRDTADLISWIEKYQLPLVGSSHQTLQKLLQKDVCQSELEKAGIPVPTYRIVRKNEIKNINQINLNGKLEFPLVIKPTQESRSNGVRMVHTRATAYESILNIFNKYPKSNVLIEAFLPGNDVTCGYVEMGDKKLLLPSYCRIKGLDCKEGIYSEFHYTQPHTIETHPRIEDTLTLTQLKEYMPRIVDLFDIKGTTRVDARSDNSGRLNFFDVNGMPGLNFPSSAIIKQVATHFPGYDTRYLFECLLHTIIGDSLLRYNMTVSSIIQTQHLFNLKSESAIKI